MSNWSDLILIHGNVEGARAAFERACEMIIRATNPLEKVRGIRPNQGDGGIDIYVGDLGRSPVDVYQCKYFVGGVGKPQKQQIRDSYKTAISSTSFQVRNWYLCLPVNLSVEETIWFESWAADCTTSVMTLPPAQLIFSAETSGLASLIFKRDDSLKLDWIMEDLKKQNRDPWIALVEQTESDCYKILLSLLRTHHGCIDGKYEHLDAYFLHAEAGDRLYACEYLKSVLVGELPDNQKIWILNMLTDTTMEPIAFRFIRRYDALVAKARELHRLDELSTSEFYSTWNFLRSPELKSLRERAHWRVTFS